MAAVGARFTAAYSMAEVGSRFAAGHSLASIGARLSGVHTLRAPLGLRVQGRHGLTAALALRFQGKHELEAVVKVGARLRAVHSMFTPAIEFAPSVSATIDGAPLGLFSFSVSASESSYCLQCEAAVQDLAAWDLCAPGSALVLTVGEVSLHFVVDARSRSSQFGDASFSITARSRASRLDKSYAGILSRTWTNTTARAIAQNIADAYGFALDWRLIDWPISSFASDKQSPLEALNTIKTEAAVLLSDAAGGLIIQWKYPTSPPRYESATPALELSDHDDIIQLDDSYEVRPGYNVVRVMDDGSTSASAEVTLQEWTGPDKDDPETFATNQRCIAAFSYPYQALTLRSDCPVSIFPQGRVYFETTEERVSIVGGKGSLTYPAEEILDYSYHCGALGALKAAGRNITTATAGQSLVTVKYRASYQRFIVQTTAYKKMQFWTEAQSEVGEAVNILRVVRAPGDVEAPDIITDALCTCEAIARERGRNFLDDQGFSKMRYEATTPFRGFVEPGGVARIEDVSRGEVFYAKITGWKLSQDENGLAQVWDLERAI